MSAQRSSLIFPIKFLRFALTPDALLEAKAEPGEDLRPPPLPSALPSHKPVNAGQLEVDPGACFKTCSFRYCGIKKQEEAKDGVVG